MAAQKHCKDCPEGTDRPAPFPGPRCATHNRELKKSRKTAAHEKHVQQTYGLEPGEYEKLYRQQGGRCAICKWARGAVKRLSVDHDHETGLVRGLLCGPCNQMMGYLKNDPEAWLRGYEYLMAAMEANIEKRLHQAAPQSPREDDHQLDAPGHPAGSKDPARKRTGKGWPAAVYP